MLFRFVMGYHTFIMYPTSATSLILGRKLIANDHDLSFFCPSDVHRRQANTTQVDLKIAALGLLSSVEDVDNLENLSDADFVIFPALDVDHAEKREIFAKMMKDLFQ